MFINLKGIKWKILVLFSLSETLALFLQRMDMKFCQVKNYLCFIIIFCLMAGSLSAKNRKKVPEIKADSCTVLLPDSAGIIHHFPMIMVGNALSLPDTVSIRLLSLVNDSLLNDTVEPMFGNKKELIDFFVRNIGYPHQLKDLNMEDDLHLLMKIDKDGVLTESEVLHAEIPEMKQEVLRVSKLLPALLLTDKTGRKINSTIQLPISFRILKL